MLTAAANGVQGKTCTAGLPGVVPTSILCDLDFAQWNPSGQTGGTGLAGQSVVLSSGGHSFSFVATIGSSERIVLSANPIAVTTFTPFTVTPSTLYHVRWEIEPGVEDRVRVWTGGVEPSTWDLILSTVNLLNTNTFSIVTSGNASSNAAPVAHVDPVEVDFSLLELSDESGVINRCTQFRFDNFNRSYTGGWGTATGGAVWANGSGSATPSVNGANGLISATNNQTRTMTATGGGDPWLTGAYSSFTAFFVSAVPTTTGSLVITARDVGGGNIVTCTVKNGSGGQIAAGASTFAKTDWIANTIYILETAYDGVAQVQARVYPSTATPPSFQVTNASATAPSGGWNFIFNNSATGATRSVQVPYIDFVYAGKVCYLDCSSQTTVCDDFNRTVAAGGLGTSSWPGSPVWTAVDTPSGSSVNGSQAVLSAIHSGGAGSPTYVSDIITNVAQRPFTVSDHYIDFTLVSADQSAANQWVVIFLIGTTAFNPISTPNSVQLILGFGGTQTAFTIKSTDATGGAIKACSSQRCPPAGREWTSGASLTGPISNSTKRTRLSVSTCGPHQLRSRRHGWGRGHSLRPRP